MSVIIVDSVASAGHVVPDGHPEHGGRYSAVKSALRALPGVHWLTAEPATRDQLERFHTHAHIDRILDAGAELQPGALTALDSDTLMSASSAGAGLHAAGGVVQAVDHVMSDIERTAFILARPPGHHAEPDRAMGFCLFNSIAIGACHALEAHGLERVAIVDIDVHHGNGSQCLAERDDRVFFASLHQAPLYPGTGSSTETGLNGNVLNIPLPEATPSTQWRQVFAAEVLPALAAFRPQMVLVSAGFDGHADDPLGGFLLSDENYRWIAQQLLLSAREFADSRLVSVLEGGYDCPALGRSAAAFVGGLGNG